MNRPLFSLTAKTLFAGVFAFGFAATSGATTYYWKGVSYVNSSFDNTAGYGSWSDLSNWSTVSESGADAATLPGSSDKIYGLVKYTWRQFDLDGGEWTISGWDTTGDWDRHYWRFINGTLHWAGRNSTHSDTVHLDNGATFIFDAGSYYQPSTGHGATDEWRVHAGASLSMLGELEIYKIDVELDGGSMVFAPSSLKFHTGTAQGSWLKNSGTLSMPNGISFSGGAASGTFNFVQRPVGMLELGGPITKNGKSGTYNFTLKGGTVHVTGDVSFDFSSATVTADAPVTLNVDAGASIDLSTFTYSSGAAMTKTGAGDFIFKSGMALPDTFTVSGGAVALGSSGSYDLSGVTFMSGSKVKIGAAGVTLSNWDSSISSATFVVADSYIPANGATVLTIADASLLAQAQAGLSASLAGTGVSVEISGNSLVAASHYTFNSSSVTDMNDTAGWVDGFAAAAGQPAFVSGASTVAVMDYRVPAYSSISVEDGASLTVAATRNLPAATLAAGTELNVVSEIGRIAIESESYNGYIMNTATLVGTMAPSRSLSEITDIAGNIGGGWLGNKDKLYTYVNTKVLDDGAKLRAQFIYNDSDYTKCAFVEFTKDAQGNIYATGVGAGYIPPTAAQVDFDEIEYVAATYGTSDADGAYGVKRLSFNAPVDCGGPSTVTAVGDFATTGSGSVTVDVATNCVLDLSGVDVTTAATLVKTGTGIIVFGDELPTALNISSGALALQPYVEYDMSDVTLGSGVEVKVVVDDTFKNGIAFVQPNGKTVYMSSGVYVGVGTWTTTANWVNSEIPDASTAVHVHGSGTVLTLDNASMTMPASISVEDGATLRVLADVTLPPLAIDATSKVVFGDNETYPAVSVTLAAAPATTSDATVSPVALPVIEVATNATLSVPGGTKFKNVNLRLFGTLAGNTLGRFYFGHAEYGESTYFAMCLTNATICTIGYGGNYDGGSLYFVCPESGGNVSVVGAIDVFNMMVDRRDDRGEESQYNGISFGVNNPTNLPFDVVFTDVSFWYLAQCKIAGAANLVLRNSYLYRKSSRAWAAQGRWTISDIAKVTYVNSRHFYEYPDGNSIGWNSAIDGYEAVILTNSTVQWSRPTGNSKSVMTVYDSYYDCAYDEYTSSQGQTLPDLMTGLGKLNIPMNAFYSIRGKSDVTWGSNGSGTTRTAKIAAGVKFTGSGELRVENAESGKSFTVVMQNGENTAIGPVRVLSPANYDATLLFANGANWAGTVVAGDVALTNLTDGAAASTVTFGTLDLAADFTVRVWKENGTLVNDTVNVGQYVNHGGRLVPQLLTDGASFAPGDRITLGSIGADSPLPATGRGWHCKLVDNGLDNDTKTLILSYSRGLQVILQ